MNKWNSLALALLLGATAANAQGTLESRAKLLAGANTVFSGMCAQHREDAKTATSIGAIRLADEGVELWCTCGPAEIERLVAGLSEPISKDTALSTFTQATSTCTGKQMRKATIAACPTDQEAIARADNIGAYCTCVESRLSAMSDEQLYTDLNDAYAKELLDTKAGGKELPFREIFALRKYGAGCESAKTAAN